jgi:hypothetical protein
VTRALLAIAALLWSHTATPEQSISEWWHPWALGAPCSTETDRREGTCQLEVKTKPRWK